jgi:hypothetical protein
MLLLPSLGALCQDTSGPSLHLQPSAFFVNSLLGEAWSL